jgi:hypothetical protein
MSAAIDVPVTTPMRRPSRRGSSPRPSATRIRSDVTAPMPFSICGKSP